MDAEVAAPADPTLLVDSVPSAANQPPAAANTNQPNDLGDGGNNAGTLNISMYDNICVRSPLLVDALKMNL